MEKKINNVCCFGTPWGEKWGTNEVNKSEDCGRVDKSWLESEKEWKYSKHFVI